MRIKLLHVALLVAVCGLLFFSGLGAVPFYDKGEPREATVVRAMVDSGNWVLPLRNAEFIPSKPPLFHWLAILVSKSVGRFDELTLRLPSALLGTAGVFLTYLAGAYFWSPPVGLFSALVLATSFEWWLASTIARVDMTLTFILLCFFFFFFFSYRSGGGRGHSLVLGLLLGLATLAKGPLGIVVPCLTALFFLWLRRDLSFLRKLHPVTVMLVAGIVAGSWYFSALLEGGGSFLSRLVHENVDSALGVSGHRKPVYFFIPALFSHMAPWSLFFPAVAVFLYKSRRRLAERGLDYPLVWFTVVFVFFSLASGKRPVYILSLYPAVALMLGVWLQDSSNGERSASPSWLARTAAYATGASFLLFSAVILAQLTSVDLVQGARAFVGGRDQAMMPLFSRLIAERRAAFFFWSGLAACGGVILFLAARRAAWNGVFAVIAVLMVVSFSLIKSVFHPPLAAAHTFKPFMERVMYRVNDRPLYFCRAFDNGVIFYARRSIAPYQSQSVDRGRPFYLLVWDSEWGNLRRDGMAVIDASDQTDRDRGRHVLLVEVGKDAQLAEKPISCETEEAED